jgi:SAM-dependent methyltransferase
VNQDTYLLGRGSAEVERLKRQIMMLASDSAAQLDRIGIKNGESVVDLGCGPGGVLHLLAERVGAKGSVLGIDRSSQFVQLARRFVADLGLPQVEVREGDAYDTGLPRAVLDGAHMRLLLVNVPAPERIVRELVSLVRPGGWVASSTTFPNVSTRLYLHGPACPTHMPPMREPKGSIFRSDGTSIGYSAMQASSISRSTLLSTSSRSATSGVRSRAA